MLSSATSSLIFQVLNFQVLMWKFAFRIYSLILAVIWKAITTFINETNKFVCLKGWQFFFQALSIVDCLSRLNWS